MTDGNVVAYEERLALMQRIEELEQQIVEMSAELGALERREFDAHQSTRRWMNDALARTRERDRYRAEAERLRTRKGTRHGLEAMADATQLAVALQDLVSAFARMPDAGFNDTSPRWKWWHDSAKQRDAARAALADHRKFLGAERAGSAPAPSNQESK